MKCYDCNDDACALVDRRFKIPKDKYLKLYSEGKKGKVADLKLNKPKAQLGLCKKHFEEWLVERLKEGYK